MDMRRAAKNKFKMNIKNVIHLINDYDYIEMPILLIAASLTVIVLTIM